MVLRFTNASGDIYDFQSADASVQERSGFGSAPVVTTLIPRAFRDGGAYLRRVSQPRILTIQWLIMGKTQSLWTSLRDATEILSPALDQGTLEIQPPGAGEIYSIDGSVLRLDTPRSVSSFGAVRATVQFECPFPFWRGATLQTQAISVNAANVTDTITYNGTVPVFPSVVIGGAGFGFSDPRWENLTHGGNLQTSSVAVSDVQTVEADHFLSEILRQTSGLNLIGNLGTTNRFWALHPGDNSVRCYRNGTTSTLPYEFSWYPLFSGV